jgi:hypothetical protein
MDYSSTLELINKLEELINELKQELVNDQLDAELRK